MPSSLTPAPKWSMRGVKEREPICSRSMASATMFLVGLSLMPPPSGRSSAFTRTRSVLAA